MALQRGLLVLQKPNSQKTVKEMFTTGRNMVFLMSDIF